jgi:apolipoprotein N-acyltransferase
VTIGIVQPNIAQRMKFRSYDWDTPDEERTRLQDEILSKTIALTDSLQSGPPDQRCDLIIWPETAVTDIFFARKPSNAILFKNLATTRFGAPILFGADHLRILHNGRLVPSEKYDPNAREADSEAYTFEVYNSAWLAEPGRGLNPRVYNKIVLVPFAEGIPYVQRVDFLVRLISAIAQMEPFKRGTDHTVYDIRDQRGGNPLRFGPLICYESCYPHLSRALVRNGAEMLAVITNDAWYEQTAGPAQHELEAVFRAVETHRYVARCANHGISCFIAPSGAIEEETELARDATLKRRVRGVKELTFYARWGDLFAWLAVTVTLGFLIVPAVMRRMK